MVTILNIYVMPAVATYVDRLEERLRGNAITAPLLLMKSSGGVTGVDTQARTWLEGESVPAAQRETEWQASFRYAHQGFELTVPWVGKSVTPEALAASIDNFHALHEQLYTFAQTDTPVELVTLHVTAIGRLKRPAPADTAQGASLKPEPVARQEMIVDGRAHDCPVYRRV